MSRDAAARSEFLVLEENENYAVATVGTCVILHWRRAVVAEGLDVLASAMEGLARMADGGRFQLLTTIEPGCRQESSPEVRKSFGRLLKHYNAHICAAAILYEGVGFKAALVRGAVTAINLLSGARFPNRVFAQAAPAATWLASASGAGHVPASMVVQAVGRLRTPAAPRTASAAS